MKKFSEEELVEALGQILGLDSGPNKFIEEALREGLLGDVLLAIRNGTFLDRQSVRDKCILGPLTPGLLTVDYNRGYTGLVEGCCFKTVPDDLEGSFPISGKGVWKFEFWVVNAERLVIPAADAIGFIERADPLNPWEVGKIEHLLSWASAKNRVPSSGTGLVVAPGSVSVEGESPVISDYGSRFGKSVFGEGWYGHHILAVRGGKQVG